MPKKLHDKLMKEAMRKFGTTSSPQAQAYVYGTLMKIEKRKQTKKS